jgi:prevent-host-death family protein
MTNSVGHNQTMPSYNVAEAKAHFSEILGRVSEGEEVILTKRGKAVARLVRVETAAGILGAGKNDPNINRDVLARDEWWKPLSGKESKSWYE